MVVFGTSSIIFFTVVSRRLLVCPLAHSLLAHGSLGSAPSTALLHTATFGRDPLFAIFSLRAAFSSALPSHKVVFGSTLFLAFLLMVSLVAPYPSKSSHPGCICVLFTVSSYMIPWQCFPPHSLLAHGGLCLLTQVAFVSPSLQPLRTCFP